MKDLIESVVNIALVWGCILAVVVVTMYVIRNGWRCSTCKHHRAGVTIDFEGSLCDGCHHGSKWEARG